MKIIYEYYTIKLKLKDKSLKSFLSAIIKIFYIKRLSLQRFNIISLNDEVEITYYKIQNNVLA